MARRAAFALMLFFATNAFAGRVLISNNDRPNEGFNDPTPAAPVGGNPGTTLGQQRLNVFRAAAERWQNSLDVKVDVRIGARFGPILDDCTTSAGILGFAGPTSWQHDFAGAPRANTWYPVALANQLAGVDLQPGIDDITMQFNSAIGTENCLTNTNWYYGLDGKHGTLSDLFVVAMHEIAHGLGVSGTTNEGEYFQNRPAIFDVHAFDTIAGLRWNQMSREQRRISVTNTGHVAWDGVNVRDAMARFLLPTVVLTVASRDYDIGLAAFGPSPASQFVSGRIVAAIDAANTDGPAATDGCTAFTNASEVAGRIALVDRGTCTFVTKARNAMAAGAIALVVADNVETTCQPIALGGSAPDVTIPAVSVVKRDGEQLRTQLAAGADAAVRTDPSRLAGTTASGGHLRLYAPCTFDQGSSTYHWDTTASPNLLMEPFVSGDLLHGVDLTLYQLLDMGWTLPPRTGRRILKR